MVYDGLSCSLSNFIHMGITAENIAEWYKVSREEQDQFALESQTRAIRAIADGRFKDEITPFVIPKRKGDPIVFDTDEYPRATTIEKLAKLRPAFKKDGTVTAGNASGICDGGAAVVITTGSSARDRGLKPIARLVGWGISGCDPTEMGLGPVPSTQKALADTGLSLDDMDVVEVNEAFAAQYLGVERQLGLDREKTNVNGGAIAVGHPLACSGTRITLHLIHELRRRGARYGLGTACIGGGQGITVIVEAL